MPPKRNKKKLVIIYDEPKIPAGHVRSDDGKIRRKKLVIKYAQPLQNVSANASALSASAPSSTSRMELPDDILSLINQFAKPHREMEMVVDFRFVTEEVQLEAGFSKLVSSKTPEVIRRSKLYFEQFRNRIKEIGGNPSDYVQTDFVGGRGDDVRDGIYYRKPPRKIKHIISVSDKKATAAFKKRSGLDRMVATTSVTFEFPTPIGIGGGASLEKMMPMGGVSGSGNIADKTDEITDKERERIFASGKYKKFEKDAESKGFFFGERLSDKSTYNYPQKKTFSEWLKTLPFRA